MKDTILLFALVSITILGYSQKNINYRIIEDNPDNYKRTSLTLDLTDFELCRGVALGYGIGFQTQIADFVPTIHYRKAYLDGTAYGTTRDIQPVKGMSKFSSLELGTTWFFNQAVKKRPVQVNLSSSKSRNYIHVSYINIPNVSENIYHGLDVGFMTQQRGLGLDVDLDSPPSEIWQYERVSDGYKAPVESAWGSDDNIDHPEGYFSAPRTTYHLNTLYFGYKRRVTQHLEILLDGANKATKDNYIDWYAHILFSPASTLATLEDTHDVAWNLVPVEGKKTFSNFGFRTGYSVIFASIMDVHTELGFMTGYKTKESAMNGFFWNVGFGFFIGSRYGFLKK
ncbi:MAG: hypothetical protein PHH37_00320 [Paludibacter sp.]|nr:hypothetical protein [Paludibacter sp.]